MRLIQQLARSQVVHLIVPGGSGQESRDFGIPGIVCQHRHVVLKLKVTSQRGRPLHEIVVQSSFQPGRKQVICGKKQAAQQDRKYGRIQKSELGPQP